MPASSRVLLPRWIIEYIALSVSPACPNCGEEMIPPSSLLKALRTRATWNCPRCWFEILKETDKVKVRAGSAGK